MPAGGWCGLHVSDRRGVVGLVTAEVYSGRCVPSTPIAACVLQTWRCLGIRAPHPPPATVVTSYTTLAHPDPPKAMVWRLRPTTERTVSPAVPIIVQLDGSD
jgi:hypothetical protein